MRAFLQRLRPSDPEAPEAEAAPARPTAWHAWAWALVCLLAGALQAAALAWPTALSAWPGTAPGAPSGIWQIASLATLVLALLRARSLGQAAGRGWLFAWSWLACTFWWLFVSMHTYGGLAAWMAVAAVLALAGALALPYAAATWVLAMAAPRSRGGQALLFAALWTLAELARGRWLTGFPWGAGGYAQVDLLGALGPWVGVYGLGALAALLAYALGVVLHKTLPRARVASAPQRGFTAAPQTLTSAVAIALLALVVGLFWSPQIQDAALADTRAEGTVRVWLLQGNVAQNEKFETGKGVAQALRWYPEQIEEAQAAVVAGRKGAPQLVVAPETALPMLPQQMPADRFWSPLLKRLADQQSVAPARRMAVLVGLPLGAFETGYTNSAWGITSEKAAAGAALIAGAEDGTLLQPGGGSLPGAGFYRYNKHHLVPFGEFIPPLFRWFTDLMQIPLGDFARGNLVQPQWVHAGQRIAPNICYEDLFGEELAAAFGPGQAAPTVLVNLSNIAWFGDTLAIDQHLQISRMRAKELGRPMLRATNTGATAAIDHRGTVVDQLPRLSRGRLEVTVEGRSGLTPYAQWVGTWGLAPLWALCLGVLGMAVLAMLWRAVVPAAATPRR